MSYRNTVKGVLTAAGTTIEGTHFLTIYCRHQVPVVVGFQWVGGTGVLTLEGTMDGINWVPVGIVGAATPLTIAATATGPGMYASTAAMLPLAYRVRCSTFTTGPINVTVALLPTS